MRREPALEHARPRLWLVLLVVCGLAATVLTVVPLSISTAVPETGGTVASTDGDVAVEFAPGEVSSGTRIRVRTGLGGPAPPHYVAPLARPFDIEQVTGHAFTGIVSVRYGALPQHMTAEDLVMLVEEPSGWHILDTTYDATSGRITTRWPHFSRGVIGVLDPLFDARDATVDAAQSAARSAVDGVERGVDWTGRQYDDVVERGRDFAAWAKQRRADLAAKVVEGVVASTGGTTHVVECTPKASEWAFEGSGPGTSVALTGCAEPLNKAAGSWPVHVGNRLPYAMLLRLPPEVAPPGFTDSFVDLDPEDFVISMLWGLKGLTVLPAGEDVKVAVAHNAGSTVQIDGYTDATTLGVKAFGLIIAGLSTGSTSVARAEVKGALKAKRADNVRIAEALDRFLRERRAHDTSYSVAQVAEDAVPDSDIAARLRQARRDLNATEADHVLLMLSMLSCAIAEVDNLADAVRTRSLRDGVGDVVRELFDRCYEPAMNKFGPYALGFVKDHIGPGAAKKLLRSLLNEALNVRELAAAGIAARLTVGSLGDANYLQGGLMGRCTGSQCGPPPDVVIDPAPSTPAPRSSGLDGIDWAAALRTRLYCPSTNPIDPNVYARFHDYTGDGVGDAVVSYRCAGSLPPTVNGVTEPYSQVEVFDGTSTPDALLSLGLLVQAPPASASPPDAMASGMRVREVHLSSSSVRVVGNVYPDGDIICPIYEASVTATWNGDKFDVAEPQVHVAFSC